MTLTQVAEKWDIPKSALSKACKEPKNSQKHLRHERIGRHIYVRPDDANVFAENYLARREQSIALKEAKTRQNEINSLGG